MVKHCIFQQKIHSQVQKLRPFWVNSKQNAQFINDFFVLITWAVVVFFTGDPSLVGEPPSQVRHSVSFQTFIAKYHSYKHKVGKYKSFIK